MTGAIRMDIQRVMRSSRRVSTAFIFCAASILAQDVIINVEVLFNDTSITHTSIDNDPRLHAMIGQDIMNNLNLENGDFDDDNDVDEFDFLTWQRGESFDPFSSEDLADWQSNFGNVASSTSLTATGVPEPATGIMLLLGMMTMFIRRCTVGS